MSRCLPVVVLLAAVLPARGDDEPVFSGPQPGETLARFEMQGVYGDEAEKTLDPVAAAAGKPVAIVFFHERTRPAFGLVRTVMDYAAARRKDGLHPVVVFLADDPTATATWLGQVERQMPKGVSIGISKDGLEGPGAYGLNRNVQLTILVGKEGRVTHNFALVQPGLQADGPKVLAAIVEVLGGGEVPSIASLAGDRVMPAPAGRGGPSDELAGLLRAVIRKDATPEAVDEAAKQVEAHVGRHAADRAELARITSTIVNSDRLTTYGTEKAREYLQKWAKEYAPKPGDPATDRPLRRPTREGDTRPD